MQEKRVYYKSDDITISYNPKLCIHAKECVNGLPEVWDINKKPWVNVNGAPADKIVEVIEKCPTAALKYELHNSEKTELPDTEAIVTVVKNGPLYLRGDIEICEGSGERLTNETRVALCRCGASKNKPFCDNSHLEVKFNG